MQRVVSDSATPSEAYGATRKAHWNAVADIPRSGPRACYHAWLIRQYRFLISEGARVLEIGSGDGSVLASLKPSSGVGVDFAGRMINKARSAFPDLTFLETDACDLAPLRAHPVAQAPFDAVVLSDLLNDLWDVAAVLEAIKPFCAPHTRLIINFHSHLWEWPLRAAQRFGLATPRLALNWFTQDDVTNLCDLVGFEVITHKKGFLCPFPVPLMATLCNRWLANLWPFSELDLVHLMVLRPAPSLEARKRTVSVVIPARNEAGNIRDAIVRTPEMGAGTELLFVEGNSTDDTWEVIQRECARPEFAGRKMRFLQQDGKGKGDAVRKGFAAATGEILMILDADLTVPPEILPQFYEAVASGRAEFANGVRLVYPQEEKAMRFANLCGNKFFSWAFSWLLGRPIKDTLCGTKVLTRENYARIAANRAYFGDFDPFGDFDLLFGAAKLSLKIRDIPIRYHERSYGDTNISRWRDGWILLKMAAFAARRLKFLE